MSLNQFYRAKTLLKRKLVKIAGITDNKVYFLAGYPSMKHDVVYDKRLDKWSCTCIGSSAYLKGKDCFHIKACKIMINKTRGNKR